MVKCKKLSEKQKQELVEALKVLYPTPLGERLVDRNDEKYIRAAEFIDMNFANLDKNLRVFFPDFIFNMNGNIEFQSSTIADLDVICNCGEKSRVLSFLASGKLQSVKSLKDFENLMVENMQK